MRKLTMKQKRFADEYLISGNAKQAAIKAGYSRKSSYSIGEENLRKPELLSYIEERLQDIESESIAKQEEILKYLTSVMRGEQKEAILIGMGDGVQEITYIEVSAKERIRAAELLGK
jgi:phage terminase small subunit